jgi:hypothetical protein
MSTTDFPSGQWVGFYTYGAGSQRFLMDLTLEFRQGTISGEGADGIGLFGIDGRYNTKSGECSWVKTYYGRHSVDYTGYRDGKGIWGTWFIHADKGGFHIWPISEGPPMEHMQAEVEEEEPMLAPVVPQPAPSGPSNLRSNRNPHTR